MSAATLEIDGPVARLTLARAERHNAFDDALVAELIAALDAVSGHPEVRALVLSGAGPSFSAGADLGWMQRMAAASESENRIDALELARLMRMLRHLPQVTIARVHGAALGGGVGLVACCDIAIGVPAASFGLTEVRLGLAPAVISPYVIDAIGIRQAQRYFVTGERFDGVTAQRIGLLHQLVDSSELDTAIDRSLQSVLRGGPRAVAASKQLISRVTHRTLDAQLALDEANAELIASLRVSAEGQEGLAAFFAKRAPSFAV